MYKLVAIDIDGTLLNDKHEVTNEVKSALHAAKKMGVKIVLCTGRPIGGVQQYLEELNLTEDGDFVIAYNGALVQNAHTKEVVSELTLEHQDLMSVFEISKELDCPMHYFDSSNLYSPNRQISEYTVLESYLTTVPLSYMPVEEAPKDIVIPKMMFIHQPEKLDQVIANIPEKMKEEYMLVKSAPFFLEILNPNVSKGNAVKLLAETLNIKQEEIIAIGDNGNDVTMVTYAGCGIAMENAIPELKEVANHITTSNNEHGVAEAINRFILHPNSVS
ncbi:sugar-phosphatase [Alkalicoccobacillus murimartini]|uniref:Cof subfamily protein (Haloacid dehalogenase superfamily) n=1 Tax=Alkalicoccobacillus murimartini TaxID=171685 RepID=A0ABT9YKV3_9BACI|nr:sugar-phosphatase [Alkalicoccobacillus murimartini]MDQ0208506.1 Cof subfamily protein (haloacid dehalogenase superfamily) [Alkalicoccobacillus murimartini]